MQMKMHDQKTNQDGQSPFQFENEGTACTKIYKCNCQYCSLNHKDKLHSETNFKSNQCIIKTSVFFDVF